MAAGQVPKWLTELLNEYSLEKYIEFQTSSNLHQGAIALWRLGASEERIKRFAELYSKDLEPDVQDQQEKGQGASNGLLTETELRECRHGKSKFRLLVAHFQQRLADLGGDLEKLINAEFPRLASYLASDNYQGVIEIGYGLSIGDGRIVCQGLAYLYRGELSFPLGRLRHLQFINGIGRGLRSLRHMFSVSKENPGFTNCMEDKVHFGDERDDDIYQVKMYTLLRRQWHDLFGIVIGIQIIHYNEDALQNNEIWLKKYLGRWIMENAMLLYSMAACRNNSYFLNGVTGAWGLRQIMILLNDGDKVLETAMHFMCSLFAMYIAEGFPELPDSTKEAVPDLPLEDFKKKALENDYDVHIYKLIDVCCNLCQEDEFATISKSQLCANVALTYPTTKGVQ